MFNTEKLYEVDSYMKTFEATVLHQEQNPDGTYTVVLDKTAFFPEEGGQDSDTGTLAGIRVQKVRISGGEIRHIIEAPLKVGFTVQGVIDFDVRLEKMQCHTAEHIVCGLIHSEFGFDNVGFHLGEFDVIFDVSGPLTREQLDKIEDMANEVVFNNLPIRAYYPTAEELALMSYRAKLDLTDGVRIVKIGEIDACACCAPHLSSTGQVGQIRLLEFEKHRGGTRIRLLAGKRALIEGRRVFKENYAVACELSVTQYETLEAVKKLEAEISSLKYKLKEQTKREMRREAEHFVPSEKYSVLVFEDADTDALRAFANAAVSKSLGALVLVVNDGDARRVLLCSERLPLKQMLPELRERIAFRGGGSDAMLTGSSGASVEEIRAYFAELC